MPPRSTRSQAKKEESFKKEEKPRGKEAGGKRKHDEADNDKPKKKSTPRKSINTNGASSSSTSAIDWLLSQEAFDLANPEIPQGHGEIDWDDSQPKKTPPPDSAGKRTTSSPKKDNKSGTKQEEIIRYPHSHLTPFQNLISACLLSKPISHKLGLRTIQTLLNPPFGLRTLKELDEAGYEGRRKVMWEARTQHKEKTAGQLGNVVDGIKELCGAEEGTPVDEMTALRDELKGCKSPEEAAKKVEERLTKINGIGPGVVSIFLRRVQGDWREVYPYADEKSLVAARELGIISGKDGAKELAEKVGGDRGKSVRLLDTLVGLALEKKLDEAKRNTRR